MNGWYFLATEVDDICFDYATKNVEQNNLSDLIKGKCHIRGGGAGVVEDEYGRPCLEYLRNRLLIFALRLQVDLSITGSHRITE